MIHAVEQADSWEAQFFALSLQRTSNIYVLKSIDSLYLKSLYFIVPAILPSSYTLKLSINILLLSFF
jgi:hypothetical protein